MGVQKFNIFCIDKLVSRPREEHFDVRQQKSVEKVRTDREGHAKNEIKPAAAPAQVTQGPATDMEDIDQEQDARSIDDCIVKRCKTEGLDGGGKHISLHQEIGRSENGGKDRDDQDDGQVGDAGFGQLLQGGFIGVRDATFLKNPGLYHKPKSTCYVPKLLENRRPPTGQTEILFLYQDRWLCPGYRDLSADHLVYPA